MTSGAKTRGDIGPLISIDRIGYGRAQDLISAERRVTVAQLENARESDTPGHVDRSRRALAGANLTQLLCALTQW